MATFHHPHFFSSNDLLKPPSTAKPNNNPSRRILPAIPKNAKKKEEEAWKEKKEVFVDYDEGSHNVSVQLSGIRKADLPQHKRVRVAGERFQKDWSISEVVQRVLGTKHWEDIEGLLNRWVGRFARKNFPEITQTGSIEHSIHVFRWMKNQKNYCARNDIYNMMIRLHARHNQTDQARGLFFEMQEWRCKPDAETFNALINVHGRAGQWRWAMNIKDDMLRAAVCICTLLPYRVADEGGVSGGSRGMKAVVNGVMVVVVIWCGDANCGIVGDAVAVWWTGVMIREMVVVGMVWRVRYLGHEGSIVSGVVMLIVVWDHRWRIGGGGSSVVEGGGGCRGGAIMIPPSRSTYNNLINACGSSGNWRQALQVCQMMTENGVGPDLVTHNIVLSAFKSGAQYLKAVSYFQLMIGTDIRPDTTTHNIVIHCLIKLQQYAQAIEMFNSMREKRSECKPDIVTFTSLIHLYSVSGQIDHCKAVFNTMLGEGLKPNIVTYNSLIGAYASHGMSEEAQSIFSEMKKNGFRPDVVSYTSLLNAYGRSEQPKKAREVFHLMKRNNCKPNVVSYNALIDAYGSNGFLAKAIDVLREMEQNGVHPNIVSICTLLAACGRVGQKVKIDSILSAAELRGIALNTIAYNSAIGSYMNVGDYEKGIELYRSMRKKKVKPDSVTYTVLISGGCKMSKYIEALGFLDEMMGLKIPWSKEVYSSVIYAYSKLAIIDICVLFSKTFQGRFTEAESTFTTMKVAGCSPDVVTYTTMIHTYTAVGDWEKAAALLEEMGMNNVQPDAIAFSAMLRAFNTGCQPAKVMSLAGVMREKNIPFSDAIFLEMLSACSILRDWRTTTKLVKMMEPSFPVISVGVLNQLLLFIGKSGKIETMMMIFLKIVATGGEISVSTYSIVLKNLLAAGNWRKYIEVLGWMEDAGIHPSFEMYRRILHFAQNGSGAEYAAVIQERVSKLSLGNF
ncbi:hypothetical protein RHGRI_006395 [Rhododendron griersonianum]|uniref:Pentatricopeptide repeat-containing protein n=1 Tax=Rhododendron griersonianum TaxID=479676 RepID=A0AAV6KTC4_9ERIC|nr:hypothetical protein RHGRI_006395 [Rhododendron griersonianum]